MRYAPSNMVVAKSRRKGTGCLSLWFNGIQYWYIVRGLSVVLQRVVCWHAITVSTPLRCRLLSGLEQRRRNSQQIICWRNDVQIHLVGHV